MYEGLARWVSISVLAAIVIIIAVAGVLGWLASLLPVVIGWKLALATVVVVSVLFVGLRFLGRQLDGMLRR